MNDVIISTHLLLCDEAQFHVPCFVDKIENVRRAKHVSRVCVNIAALQSF